MFCIEKTSALVDSGKNALASSNAPVTTDHISQEAYVTPTVPADEVIVASEAPTKPPKTSKGPVHAIRKFFSRLFNPSRHQNRTKTSEPVQATEIVTTTTAITNNSLESS